MKNKNKGFTLIELLASVAIIGILAAIIVASLNSARRGARDVRRIADIRNLRTALEIYYNDHNQVYPTSLNDLVTSGQIPAVPTDILGNTPYSYAYYPASRPSFYHLGSSLEDSANDALKNDIDCDSSGSTCPAGVPYVNGFNGADTGKCNAADAGVACYDVVP